MSTQFLPLISAGLWVSLGTLAAATLFGFWGRAWWRFELFSHFRLQYCLGAFLVSAGLTLLSQWAGAALAAGIGLLNLAFILPLYRRPHLPPADSQRLKILFANVLGTNQRYDLVLKLIHSEKPDMFLFVEARPGLLGAITPHLQDYPHRCLFPKDDNYGMALFSRVPCEAAREHVFDRQSLPALFAHLSLEGRQLTLIGAHPPPPKSRRQVNLRNQQMEDVARMASQQPGEVLLLGDLNMTSWSPAFQDLLKTSNLRDSRQGFGLQPSWPVQLPMFFIPIDHALHSPGIRILQRWTSIRIGSDHLPVVLEIELGAAGNDFTHPQP